MRLPPPRWSARVRAAVPSLIEAHTLRMLGHAVHDGAEYVPRELLAEWEARDPVIGYRRKLAAIGVSEEQLEAIDRRCRAEVVDAVTSAEASPWPDPATVTRGVYAPSAVAGASDRLP